MFFGLQPAFAQVSFNQVFLTTPILQGSEAVIRYSFGHNNAGGDTTGITFSHTLPAGITVATSASPVSETCATNSSVISAVAGSNSIIVTGATISSSSSSCRIDVRLDVPAVNSYTTSFVTLSSTQSSTTTNSTATSASLVVQAPNPEINVTGSGNTIVSGDTTPDTADRTDFGSLTIGDIPLNLGLVIENTGTTTLNLGSNSVLISGAQAGNFSVFSQPSTTVNAGSNRTFALRYNPLATGVHTAIVSIASDDIDENPYTFTIQGTALTPPEIDITGNSVSIPNNDITPTTADDTDFGSLNVIGGSVTHTFTVSNFGETNLSIGGFPLVTISGTNAADFNLTTDIASFIVPANGGTRSFTITFDPTASGPRTATVSVSSDDSDENPYTFAIQGLATGVPDINLTGNGMTVADGDTSPSVADDTDFGSVDFTSGSVSRTFTIENTGSEALNSIVAGLSNATDFSISTAPATSVAAGGSTTVLVQFDPASAGSKTSTLTIASNDPDENPYTFDLAGIGSSPQPEIEVQGDNSSVIVTGTNVPNIIDGTDYNSVGVGASKSTTFYIINKGVAASSLTVGTPIISGANSGDFSIISSPSSPVAGDSASTNMTVSFSPTALGARSAVLTIPNSDADEAPFVVNLVGTGAAVPNSFTLQSGNNQSAGLNSAFSQSLVVRVADGSNNPIPGVSINFAAPDTIAGPVASAILSALTVTTDANGLATITATANNVAGTYAVSATLNGFATVSFFLTNLGPPDIRVDGDNSTSIANGDASPATLDGTDMGAVPVGTSNNTTFFVVNTGGLDLTVGSVSLSGSTDFTVTSTPTSPVPGSGFFTTFVVNYSPTGLGADSAIVSIPNNDANDAPFTFSISANGVTGSPANLAMVSGGGQSAGTSNGFANPFVVRLTDVGGNPVQGATVTFATPGFGASASLSSLTAVTGVNGLASIAATANSTTGNYSITASSPGTSSVNFSATNTDATGPQIISFERLSPGAQTTNNDNVRWRIIFDEDVANVDNSDFTFSSTSPTTATGGVTVTATANIVDYEISGGDMAGLNSTLTLSFLGTQDITDLTGNPLVNLVPIGANEPSYIIVNNPPDLRISSQLGGGTEIVNGDTTPSVTENTDFGSSPVGTPVNITFGISNIAGFSTLVLPNNPVTISGPAATDFTLPAANSSSTLPGVGHTAVVVRFTPSVAGVRNAIISIASDDPDENPYTFAVTGTGTGGAPEIAVTGNGNNIASSLSISPTGGAGGTDTAFGQQNIAGPMTIKTYTIQNTGTAPLNLGTNAVSLSVDLGSGDFTVVQQPDATVPPFGSTTFQIQFDASFGGVRRSTLSIANNDADENPFIFRISGTGIGIPDINVQGNSINIANGDTTPATADGTNFGSVNLGGGSVQRDFTVQNIGSDILRFNPGAATLSGSGDFTIISQPQAAVSTGFNTYVGVVFTPSSAGQKTATLTLVSDDPDEGSFTFMMQGTGIATSATGTVTLIATNADPLGNIVFTSSTPLFNLSAPVSMGVGQVTVSGLGVGVHIIKAADLSAFGYGITSIVCSDTDSTGDVAARSATINLAAGEAVTCTFALVETREVTSRQIADYLGARNQLVLTHQPDLARRMGRLGAGTGEGVASTAAFGLSAQLPFLMDGNLNSNIFSYKASARSMANFINSRSDVGLIAPRLGKWDFWSEGQFALFDSKNNQSGQFGIFHVGADYLARPNVLLGVRAQVDWMDQKFADTNGKLSGRGWMVGPYGLVRLNEKFYVDWSAAWGKSANDISPFGTYNDNFRTTRWMVDGALIGEFALNNWTVRPALRLRYIEETQQAYTDSLNVAIPEQRVAQGELRFGPRFSTSYTLDDGAIFLPWFEFSGGYTINSNGKGSSGSFIDEIEGINGSASAGFDLSLSNGATLTFKGQYDGIGSTTQSYGGTLGFSVPLN